MFLIAFLLLKCIQGYALSQPSHYLNQKLEIPTPEELLTKDYGFNTQSAYSLTGAIILILSGAFMIFYGYGMFKGLMFVTGAYFSALFTFAVLNTLQSRGITNFGEYKDLIYFCVVIVMAILGGLLLWWLWKVGMFVLGGLFGYVFATSLLQIEILSQWINTELYRWIFIIGLSILFGVAALYSQKYLVIVASAFVGAFALFLGIDYFAKTGFGVWFYRAVNYGQVGGFTGAGYGMIAGFLAVGLFSSGLQLSHANRDGK